MKDFLKPWTDVSIQSIKKQYHNNYWKTHNIHMNHPYITKTIIDLKPKRLLEIGCGNGHNLLAISKANPDIEIYGIDISLEGIKRAHMYINGHFYVEDARQLHFDDNFFDVILTVHALEQMKYIIKDVANEIYRVSSDKIVLFEPFFVMQNIFGKWNNIRSEYVQGIPFYIEDAGFEIREFRRLKNGLVSHNLLNQTGILKANKWS
jgi:ubiquinone/menaquinone biosynthesis C-methylase UbiE